MRKLLLMTFALLLTSVMYGQLSGTYAIPSGDFPTIRSAFAALNLGGVAAGGVTFDVATGYVETSPDSLILTASGRAGGLITFQKSGTLANPVVQRTDIGFRTTSLLGGQGDAVITLDGCDFVVFNGIDVTATDSKIEYGYFLRKGSAVDGCLNVTISNCNITMTRGTTNAFVTGIYSSNLDKFSPLNLATGVLLTNATGRHENVTITGNTIGGVSIGIMLRGYNDPTAPSFDLYDKNFVIGTNGAGNIIRNYGNATSTSIAYGLYAQYNKNLNISYNTFNNVAGGGVASAYTLYSLYNLSSGALSGGDVVISNNSFVIGLGTNSSTVYTLYNAQSSNSVTISDNTFSYGTIPGTNSIYNLYQTAANNILTVSNNSYTGTNNRTGASGTVYSCYISGAPVNGLETVSNNNFSNFTQTGTGAFYGIYSTSSSVTSTKEIYGNLISGITAGGIIYGIYSSAGLINNIYENQVNTLNGGSTMYCMYAGSSTSLTVNCHDNIIRANSTTGASAVYGVYAYSSTTGGTNNTYRNSIYDLTSGGVTGTVFGIYSVGGASMNFFNNFISDLKAPAATGTNAINGIYYNSAVTGSAFYNTVFLNASSSSVTTFGTSALYAVLSTNLDMRNNILVNKSNHKGAAYTVAFRRSGAITTGNYNAASNNNNLWASSASPTLNYLFYDGTTGPLGKDSTIALFKTRVAPRDAASFSEDPPFMNSSTAPYDLHLTAGIQSKCESGASSVTTPFAITDDRDGDKRYPDPTCPIYQGYPPSSPDVGADEFAGIPSFNCLPPVPGNTVTTANNLCFGQTITLSLQNPITGTGNTFQWQQSPNNISYTNIQNATAATYTFTPQVTAYYRCIVTCQVGPDAVISNPLQVSFASEVTSSIGSERCGIGSAKLFAEGTGDTLAWYYTATGGTALGFGSPFTTPVINATTTFYVGSESPAVGTVTVGTGATTSATYSNPFYSAYSNTHNQHLVKAEELVAAGLVAGNLTSLGLNITVPSTLPMLNFSLKVGMTTATALAYFDPTALTEVYTSGSFMPVTGVNAMAFTSPVYWDGVSNLLIDICHGNPSSTTTMSRTCLANTTTYISSIHAHRTVATGGIDICPDSTTTKTTYSLRPQFIINGMSICSSPRTPVVATVTPPPVFDITESATICNDVVIPLTVLSNTTLFDFYEWSPVANLFTDAAGTVPYTGSSALTVYFRTATPGASTVTCTALNNTSYCANADQATITVLPGNPQIVASPPSLCVSGSSVLSVSIPSATGSATFQWQESYDGNNYYDIQGATNLTYVTQYIGMTTHYKMLIRNSAGATCIAPHYELTVLNPLVTGTVPGFHCGPGVVQLSATGTTGLLSWFDSQAGGAPIGTGPNFTTPYLFASKTYYVASMEPGTLLESAGKKTPTGTTGGLFSNYGMVFTANQDIKLQAVDVFPAAAGGQLSIALYNSSQTLLYGPTFFNYPAGNGTTPYTIPLDFQISAGSGYRLMIMVMAGGNLIRESVAPVPAYPINNGTLVSLTGAVTTLTGTPVTSSYNWFYNWRVMYGCSGPMTPVLATINLAPFYELTLPQGVCNNERATLAVTNGTSYFTSFKWKPGDHLFTDLACTIPYDTATSATTLYLKTAVPGKYEIRGYANNSTNGCTNFDTTHVVVLPATLAIASDPDSLCGSGSAALSLVPAMDYGSANIQWQSSTDGTTFSDIPGATNATYNTGVISATRYYKVSIKNHSLIECLSAQKKIFVDTPAILSTTPGERCGTGTVDLVATCTPGSTVNWFGSSLGGMVLGTGNNFTTPSIAVTTTFYAAAVSGNGGGVGAVGPVDNTFATGGPTFSSYYVSFNVEAASMILQGLHVYPSAAGDVKFNIANSSGTVLVQISYPVTASDVNVKTYIPVNFPLGTGSGYRITQTTGCVTLFRNTTGASYPYTLPGVVSITGNSFGAAYYYYYYDWRVSTKCSSPTVPVIATVIPANPVSITPNRTICRNEIHTISVLSNPTDYDEYTWTPTYDLYTDAACTLPYVTGMNKTTVYFKTTNSITTTYTCMGFRIIDQCNDTAKTTVTVIPEAAIASMPAQICVSGSTTLSLLPATGYGMATFQWQSSPDNNIFSDIAGATNQTYTTPVLTATTYYKVIIKNVIGTICQEPVFTLVVNSPQILTWTPGERCGPGTVQLAATVNSGSILNWYDAGGNQVGTGSPFTTPTIGITTSYYAAASQGGSTAFVGKVAIASNASTGGGLSTYMNFTAISDFNLQTVDLFPYGTGPGTVTIALRTSTGVEIMSRTVNVTGTTSTASPAQRVVLDFDVTGGASYRLGVNSWTGGVTNLYRDATGTYPYTLPGVVSITGPSLTPYYYFFYNWQVTTGCESARQEVLASVNVPPVLTITSSKTICTNEVYPIEVLSSVPQFDHYTWSPVANLFTDAACTQPYVALANTSIVYFKAASGTVTNYTCSASNSTGAMCTNLANTIITAIPNAVVASSPEAICFSGSATLRLSPEAGYGLATFQWQDSPDNSVYTDIAGATNQTYVTPSLLVGRHYKVIIKNESAAICSEPIYYLAVNTPSIVSSVPGSRCGIGTVDLSATAQGGTVKWYSSATGGNMLGSGNNFTTPVISASTNFFAEASSTGSMDAYVGMPAAVSGSSSGVGMTTYGLYFDALSAFTLKTVNVYPNASANNTPGTVSISVINAAGTVLHTTTVDVVGYIQSTNPNMQTVDLNFDILPATNLRLVFAAKSTSISGLMFHPSTQPAPPYPYTIPGVVSITSGTYSGVLHPELYYYFYNWKVTVGCASARTAVLATVTPPPAITATGTPSQVCRANPFTMNVTSPDPNYTFLWMPGNLIGAAHVVNPEVATQYTVTATNAGTGCVNVASVNVDVLPTPSPITITPAAPVIMSGDIQPLTVTGGSLSGNGVFGTGTTMNTLSGWPAPYTNWYGGNKHQILIRASELTAQGLYPGATINTISFQVAAVGTTFSGNLNDFRIDMGHTTSTVLTSTAFIGGLTIVSPAHTQAIAVGTVTHNLTTPFIWNGTSNLVIQTTYSNGNNGTSTDGVQMYNSIVGFVSTNYKYADSQTAAYFVTIATPTTSSTTRPNIILGYGMPTTLSWTPQAFLYLDAAATIPYAGGPQTTVYAKPSNTIGYAVTSIATTTGCLSTGEVVVTVTSPCFMPTGVTATGVTASMATISWTEPSQIPGSGYEYEVRSSGGPGSGPTGLAAEGTTFAGVVTATVSGLAPNTLYSVYVRSNCGDNTYSNWTAAYLFTTCNTISALPYTENFDGATIPNLPACWTKYSSLAGTPWINTNQVVTPFTPPHSAPNYMYVTYNQGLPKDEWLVSPAIQLTGGIAYNIKFWVNAPGYDPTPEKMKLVATTDPTLAGVTGGAVIWTRTDLMLPGYVEFVVSFTPGASNAYYFAWHAFSEANVDFIALDDVTVELGGPPVNTTVQNVTVGNGQTLCYNATNTITVAGGSTTFIVQGGGSATFVAGSKISFLIGTKVLPNGYLRGYIAPNGPWCGTTKIAAVTTAPDPVTETTTPFFTLFPNPTNGNFTLVQKGDKNYGNVKVEVFSMSGEKVLTETMLGQKHEFRFSDMPTGLYFVKVVADDYVETIKLVKTR